MGTNRAEKGFSLLAARSVWQERQRVYYKMRHDGLPRTSKPWANAADAHFPLIDMHITDLKPFWVAQAFGGDRLCDFVGMREQLTEMTEACADYFDFEMRYKTDFRYMYESAMDTMLLRQRGILQTVLDPFKNYKIKIKAIDPLFI